VEEFLEYLFLFVFEVSSIARCIACQLDLIAVFCGLVIIFLSIGLVLVWFGCCMLDGVSKLPSYGLKLSESCIGLSASPPQFRKSVWCKSKKRTSRRWIGMIKNEQKKELLESGIIGIGKLSRKRNFQKVFPLNFWKMCVV